eukprot:scaffold7114_cov67-Phaeocystis_antarctica.AAC.5
MCDRHVCYERIHRIGYGYTQIKARLYHPSFGQPPLAHCECRRVAPASRAHPTPSPAASCPARLAPRAMRPLAPKSAPDTALTRRPKALISRPRGAPSAPQQPQQASDEVTVSRQLPALTLAPARVSHRRAPTPRPRAVASRSDRSAHRETRPPLPRHQWPPRAPSRRPHARVSPPARGSPPRVPRLRPRAGVSTPAPPGPQATHPPWPVHQWPFKFICVRACSSTSRSSSERLGQPHFWSPMPPAVLAVTAEGGQLRCACGSFGRHADHVDRSPGTAVLTKAISARSLQPQPIRTHGTNSHKRRLAAPRSHSPLAAPLAARRFPLAAARVPTRAFNVPTGNRTGATGNSCGHSRFRLGARGGNSPGRLAHQGGASRRGGRRLAAASRPGRGRLAAARCAAPLPRAPPLPPRSLPTCTCTCACMRMCMHMCVRSTRVSSYD